MLSVIKTARPLTSRTTAKLLLAQARSVHRFPLSEDIHITKNGDVRLTIGAGGRSSRTGLTATVFGATGFLGRLLTAKLGKHGTVTIVPFRNEYSRRQVKINGDLGVINFHEMDIRNIQSIENCVAHSDIVFNLLGSDQNTKNFSMADANIEGSRRIAEAAKKYGVPRFVQVSTYNADPNSASTFFATKGLGEQVVRDIIPDATIVRPSPMYFRNSPFLNEMIGLTKPGGNVLYKQSVYPTHAIQVAEALERIGYDDSTAGKTFELYGPDKYSKAELREMLKYMTHIGMYGFWPAAIGYNIPLPEKAVQLWCWINEKFNSSQVAITSDTYTRSKIDQVIDPAAYTYKDLGMSSDVLADWLYKYAKPHIVASSQALNRTVYDKEEVEKLREFVNTPKNSLDLFSLKG